MLIAWGWWAMRCKVIEMAGGTFFERPENSETVKPLLEGFGEHEKKKDIDNHEEGEYEEP